jgi:hypothetical protein
VSREGQEPDRLEVIALRLRHGEETPADVEWLVEEVRRLRAELAHEIEARPFGESPGGGREP